MSNTTRWEPQKLQQWYEVLMDFYILNPTATAEEAATALMVHPQTVNLVRNSDLWQRRFAERRQAFIDKADDLGLSRLQGKVVKLAEVSVDLLTERIEKERLAMGLQIEGVRETADMALKALGYGVKAPVTSKVVNNTQNIVISSDDLAEARRRMRLQVEHEHGTIEQFEPTALSAASGL